VAVGVVPGTAWLGEGAVALGPRGGVQVDDHLRTSAPDVWAAGDCAALPDGRVEQLWYTARAQGAVAGCALAGQPRPYAPGVAYNSAKFFSLEWQAYGAYGGAPDDDHATHTAEADGRMLRIVTDGAGQVVGLSALGLRLRAEVCRAWIGAGLSLDAVLARLPEARFDEELSPRLHARLAAALT
jgi:NADPH-dependent 2,4-dienoyl-CoA reductase/sulfur reductase-like enzyme